jgi:competence protein ComFB
MRPVNFELCRNYYERLVFEEITARAAGTPLAQDADSLEDIACLALNQLPVRYVRFAVDASFYMQPKERVEVEGAVADAVSRAMSFVASNPRESGVR